MTKMTFKEALDRCVQSINGGKLLESGRNFMMTCMEALNKQIPQKPKTETVITIHNSDAFTDKEYSTRYVCPSCGNRVRQYVTRNDYCNCCGQAIDWSEGNK